MQESDFQNAGYKIFTKDYLRKAAACDWTGWILVRPGEVVQPGMAVFFNSGKNGEWERLRQFMGEPLPHGYGIVRKRCPKCVIDPSFCPSCPIQRDRNWVKRLAAKAGYNTGAPREFLRKYPDVWDEGYYLVSSGAQIHPDDRWLSADSGWLHSLWEDLSPVSRNSSLYRRSKTPYSGEATARLLKAAGYSERYYDPGEWDPAYEIVTVGTVRSTEMEWWTGTHWALCTTNEGEIQRTFMPFRKKAKVFG